MTELLTHDQYFPDEAFDVYDEPGDPDSLSGTYTMAKKVGRAHLELTGDEHEYLSAEQEWQLARQIQAGAEAAAQLNLEQTDAAREAELVEIKQAGLKAREDLLFANLPFAAYYARLSMGLKDTPNPDNTEARERQRRRPRTRDFRLGDITNLKSPNAELDDRIQLAALAMWRATEKFEPRCDKDGKPTPVKFITAAAYAMYRTLSDSCSVDEQNKGWATSRGVFERVHADEKRLAEGIDYRPQHTSAEGGRHDGYHPIVVKAGRKSEPLDRAKFSIDEVDVFDTPLTVGLEEICAADNDVEDEVERREFVRTVYSALDGLDEREASIIRMYFGLNGGGPLSTDEIGARLGVSRQRVLQIEQRALGKLRNPENAGPIQEAIPERLSSSVLNRSLGELCTGAAHIKTEPLLVPGVLPRTPEQLRTQLLPPTISRPFIIASEYTSQPQRQKSAALPPREVITVSDEWDAPVRTRLSPRQLERKSQEAFVTSLIEVISYNAGVFADDSDPLRVKELARDIASQSLLRDRGANKVAYAWNNKFGAIAKGLNIDLSRQQRILSVDKIVSLFSSLLVETSTVEDEIDLTIPKRFDGQLNNVGSGFKAGTLRIHGNVGDYAAENAGTASALCSIEIDGNAGDWCARSAGGSASVTVRGSVGDYFGAHVQSNGARLCVEGDAGKATGYQATGGEIIIGGITSSVALARGSKTGLTAGKIKQVILQP